MDGETAGRRAVVVGGGIGGLAAGIGLARSGWHVVVCERAPSLEPVGAGLMLWPNGMAALAALGLEDAVRRSGRLLSGTGLRRAGGGWLSRTDGARLARRHGHGLVAVARAELVEVLAGALPHGVLRLGTTVSAVVAGDEDSPAEVVCGHETLSADLVVAADGIDSVVRRQLWRAHPSPGYRGYTAWRALVRCPDLDLGEHAAETWGRGDRFGVVPLGQGRAYVYATARTSAGAHAADPERELTEVRELFAGWHAPIPELLDRMRPADLLRHDVRSLVRPVRRPSTGRVVLVGDAAHGMEPNLGQGACLALEDAAVLTSLLAEAPVTAALDAYTATRVPRVTRLSRQSAMLGLATRSRSRALAALRDLAVRSVPDALSLRGVDAAAGWRPHPPAPTTEETP